MQRCALHVHPHMHQIPSTTIHRATSTNPYIQPRTEIMGNEQGQWYYLPNPSTTPKTVFRAWVQRNNSGVFAPDSDYRLSIGCFEFYLYC
jgi:glucan-binding YG repeat protein